MSQPADPVARICRSLEQAGQQFSLRACVADFAIIVSVHARSVQSTRRADIWLDATKAVSLVSLLQDIEKSHPAVHITGIEGHAGEPAFWTTSNFERDQLPKAYPGPVVLWLTRDSFARFKSHALDLSNKCLLPIRLPYDRNQIENYLQSSLQVVLEEEPEGSLIRFAKASDQKFFREVSRVVPEDQIPLSEKVLAYLRGRQCLCEGDIRGSAEHLAVFTLSDYTTDPWDRLECTARLMQVYTSVILSHFQVTQEMAQEALFLAQRVPPEFKDRYLVHALFLVACRDGLEETNRHTLRRLASNPLTSELARLCLSLDALRARAPEETNQILTPRPPGRYRSPWIRAWTHMTTLMAGYEYEESLAFLESEEPRWFEIEPLLRALRNRAQRNLKEQSKIVDGFALLRRVQILEHRSGRRIFIGPSPLTSESGQLLEYSGRHSDMRAFSLRFGRRATRVMLLCGPPGVGKTSFLRGEVSQLDGQRTDQQSVYKLHHLQNYPTDWDMQIKTLESSSDRDSPDILHVVILDHFEQLLECISLLEGIRGRVVDWCNRPNFKLIVSIQEDNLHRVALFDRSLKGQAGGVDLIGNRFYLDAIRASDVRALLDNLCPNWSARLRSQVVAQLSVNSGGVARILPDKLQVVCQQIESTPSEMRTKEMEEYRDDFISDLLNRFQHGPHRQLALRALLFLALESSPNGMDYTALAERIEDLGIQSCDLHTILDCLCIAGLVECVPNRDPLSYRLTQKILSETIGSHRDFDEARIGMERLTRLRRMLARPRSTHQPWMSLLDRRTLDDARANFHAFQGDSWALQVLLWSSFAFPDGDFTLWPKELSEGESQVVCAQLLEVLNEKDVERWGGRARQAALHGLRVYPRGAVIDTVCKMLPAAEPEELPPLLKVLEVADAEAQQQAAKMLLSVQGALPASVLSALPRIAPNFTGLFLNPLPGRSVLRRYCYTWFVWYSASFYLQDLAWPVRFGTSLPWVLICSLAAASFWAFNSGTLLVADQESSDSQSAGLWRWAYGLGPLMIALAMPDCRMQPLWLLGATVATLGLGELAGQWTSRRPVLVHHWGYSLGVALVGLWLLLLQWIWRALVEVQASSSASWAFFCLTIFTLTLPARALASVSTHFIRRSPNALKLLCAMSLLGALQSLSTGNLGLAVIPIAALCPWVFEGKGREALGALMALLILVAGVGRPEPKTNFAARFGLIDSQGRYVVSPVISEVPPNFPSEVKVQALKANVNTQQALDNLRLPCYSDLKELNLPQTQVHDPAARLAERIQGLEELRTLELGEFTLIPDQLSCSGKLERLVLKNSRLQRLPISVKKGEPVFRVLKELQLHKLAVTELKLEGQFPSLIRLDLGTSEKPLRVEPGTLDSPPFELHIDGDLDPNTRLPDNVVVMFLDRTSPENEQLLSQNLNWLVNLNPSCGIVVVKPTLKSLIAAEVLRRGKEDPSSLRKLKGALGRLGDDS